MLPLTTSYRGAVLPDLFGPFEVFEVGRAGHVMAEMSPTAVNDVERALRGPVAADAVLAAALLALGWGQVLDGSACLLWRGRLAVVLPAAGVPAGVDLLASLRAVRTAGFISAAVLVTSAHDASDWRDRVLRGGAGACPVLGMSRVT